MNFQPYTTLQNKTHKFLLLLTVLLSITDLSTAQTLNSTYFLDHDNTRFRINPALMPDDTIKLLAGIAVSNISVAPQSNISPSAFIFPVDGEFVTGFDSRVSAEQFLGGLNEQNRLNIGANFGLLTIGFRPEKEGFATIELNIRSNNLTDAPKSLFSFIKNGPEDDRFDIRNFNVSSANFIELALGYSRKLGKMFQVGGRVKILGGLGRSDMLVDQIMIDYDSFTELMELSSTGSLMIYCPGINIKTKTNPDGTVVYDLSSISFDKFNIAGFGLAFDLGVSCTPIEGLEIQAALQDLGFLSWKNTISASMSAGTVVQFKDDDPQKIVNSLLNFEGSLASGHTSMALPFIFRIGARYAMPFYNRLSFGILETLENIGQKYTYNDFRLGATVTPIDQISVAINYGITSLGSAIGLACNFNLGPVQLFLGTDSMLMQFTSQGVPASKLNTTVSGGLLLQFR